MDQSIPQQRTVAIIGCGASGALLAIALLRQNGCRPLRLVIVEPRERLGRGVAYSTPDPLHLLNVPAGSMSAFDDEPGHLLHWFRSRGDAVGPGAFVSRRDFGAYMEETLAQAISAAPAGTSVEILRDRVHRLEPGVAVLASGARLFADDFALAIGNGPPRHPVPASASLSSDRYIADPWLTDPRQLARPGELILLVGTGLTMVDVALSLAAGEAAPKMVAVSRNGLAPRCHRPDQPRAHEPFSLPPGPVDLSALMRSFFVELSRVGRFGGDASDVVDAMRPVTQRIWIDLAPAERRWFLAHLRRQWEVHRHRMAPAVGERVERLRADGRLRIEAAAVTALEPCRDGVLAQLEGDGSRRRIRFDRVVNCAGPEDDVRRSAAAPLPAMLAAGRLRPDPLGLGIDVDVDGRPLGADGEPAPSVHVIGPLRKGSLWETTAIPEIRRQAWDLAARLLQRRPVEAIPVRAA